MKMIITGKKKKYKEVERGYTPKELFEKEKTKVTNKELFVKDDYELEIDNMNKKDPEFEMKLRRLDEELESIKDPELADYKILTTLRDFEDQELEQLINVYEHKFGGLTI